MKYIVWSLIAEYLNYVVLYVGKSTKHTICIECHVSVGNCPAWFQKL